MTQALISDVKHFAYKPVLLQDAKTNAVQTAERPLCALVQACVSYLTGGPRLGTARDHEDMASAIAFASEYAQQTWDIPTWKFMEWVYSIAYPPQEYMDIPTEVGNKTLSAYQISACSTIRRSGGVLNIDCGLGKTVTALAAAKMLFDAWGTPVGERMISVVCPLNAVGTWASAKVGLDPSFGILKATSMDSVHKLSLDLRYTHILIFDEAHGFGEPTTRRTKAAHLLRWRARAALCLTGTLLHGGMMKALSVLDLAIPGMSAFANRWNAGEHFHCLVKKKLGGRTVTSLERPTGPNFDAFKSWLSHWITAMGVNSPIVRAEVQLPDHSIFDQRVGEPWESVEDTVVREVNAALEAGLPLPSASAMAHVLAGAGLPAKVAWLMERLMEDDTEKPIVVFAAYLDSLNAIEVAFNEAGISYVRVDGAVTGKERISAEKQFQDRQARVFLGQLHASSVAMNLQVASRTITVDHTWSAIDYTQSLARTWRRGQADACSHTDLFANSFQLRIVQRLRAQQDFNASVTEWQDLRRILTPGFES